MPELKFTNDHECIHIDGNIAWIGITAYAQEALGDLVYVELPDIGKTVKKGDDLAVVESVKTAAEVYTPVDGEVIQVNEDMPDDLDLITKPVAEGGWIAKVRMSDPAQAEALMDQAKYDEYLKTVD